MTGRPPKQASGAHVGVVDQRALGMGAVEELRSSMRGEVITPADAPYEERRRVWNGVIDRRPALIVRCASVDDVLGAMHFARVRNLPIAVRGGGHNVSGSSVCAEGLVLDLSLMNRVRVDAHRSLVSVEGGATLGDVDRTTQAFGLAVPMGMVSQTGIGGLSLHGGVGFLTRRHGLTADSLVGAEVVTADGRFITVDARRYPDLFWALRGGGAGYGVVTSFEFRAHPVGPQVSLAFMLYPARMARQVLRFFRDYMAQVPDEVTAYASLWSAPHDEAIPAQARGRPVVVLAACHCGAVAEGARVLQPVRALGNAIADLSGAMPLTQAQRLFDREYPNGRRYYWKSHFLKDLTEETIVAMVAHAARRPSSLTSMDMVALGGAFGRVSPDATAFANRDAAYLLAIESSWQDSAHDAANIAWARTAHRDLQRFSTGTYLNFPGFWENAEDLLNASFRANYSRLRAIRAKYDPTNLLLGDIGRRA